MSRPSSSGYDGLYHDILHEPEKAAVTADLMAWLEERVAAGH